MHELSGATKRVVDILLLAITATAAGMGALTLADWALIVTIAAGGLSAAWQLMRFYDRFKYGRRAAD